MKKIKLITAMALLSCVLSAAALSACAHAHTFSGEWQTNGTHHWHEATCEHAGERDSYGEHTWDNGVVASPAGCTADGVTTYTCTVCGAQREEKIPATGHSYSQDWMNDNTHHWHNADCEHIDLRADYSEHVWEEEVLYAPTCTSPGRMRKVCSVCGASTEEEIPATGHAYAEEWTVNEYNHWRVAVCEHTGERTEHGEHSWENGACTVCGMLKPSMGLEYELSADKTYYIVTGMGSCTDRDIVIPSVHADTSLYEVHQDLPVKEIAEHAFSRASVRSVVLPKGLEHIRNSAFAYGYSLERVVLPEGLKSIGDLAFQQSNRLQSIDIPAGTQLGWRVFGQCTALASVTLGEGILLGGNAFYGCTALTGIVIPAGISSIGSGAFGGCSSLASVTLSSDVKVIGNSAFSGCAITEIALREGLERIGSYAFSDCSALKRIVLPAGLKSVETGAFRNCTALELAVVKSGLTRFPDQLFAGCTSLKALVLPASLEYVQDNVVNGCGQLSTIYFMGTQEQYKNLTRSGIFQGCAVYYYSDQKPAEGNGYWHYDPDGVTPVIWA